MRKVPWNRKEGKGKKHVKERADRGVEHESRMPIMPEEQSWETCLDVAVVSSILSRHRHHFNE